MASGIQESNNVPGNLRKQLAVAVRSIQWSYAIFWTPSPTQQGVLQWEDGYYNGDIKTRRTFQTMELKPDKIRLQRSEQLRELYLSLLDNECSETQSKRLTVSLSPEDLSDAEWYYLVCMSFLFNPGQGLPGSALAAGIPIWLCNAQYADSKVFFRSLLAKSASIQTVVCFPYLGGVIELGVTELVQEDPSLIQHVKTSLLDFSKPDCSDRFISAAHNADDNQDPMASLSIHNKDDKAMELEDNFSKEYLICGQDGDYHEEFNMGSPDDCSLNTELYHQTEDSSDCISQVVENHKYLSNSNNFKTRSCMKKLQEHNDTKLSSLDLTDEDLHYKRIITTVLRRSASALSFHTCDYKSSFVAWGQLELGSVHRSNFCQSMLKKVLFEVPLMHGDNSLKPADHADHVYRNNMVTDDHRRDMKLLALSNMVTSIIQNDKASILDDTIKYVRKLEARVEEHESDDYDSRNESNRKTCVHKRKASHVEFGTEDSELNNIMDMNVRIQEQEVAIEIRYTWREYLLLDIMDAVNSLHLDAYSVWSETHDGICTLNVNSKFRGTAIKSAGMIKEAIWKAANKC